MAKSEQADYIFKILLIGDSNVGKTSILRRFTEEQFIETHLETIGVDFKIETIELDGKTVKLQIWDTAGSERFKSIGKSLYRGAHGVIIVYDITNTKSFESLNEWLNDIQVHVGDDVSKLIIGNKDDLWVARTVTYKAAQDYADRLGYKFMETSAKTSTNVSNAFCEMAKQIKNRIDNHGRIEDSHEQTIKLTSSEISPQTSYCCFS